MNSEGITIYLQDKKPSVRKMEVYLSKQRFKTAVVNANVDNTHGDGTYFNNRTGGYYILEKGHNYHKDEMDAAKILAKNGYIVRLRPESVELGGVRLKNGFPDGDVNTKPYDQWTSSNGSKSSIQNAFRHGHEKGVDVIVMYDKSGTITPQRMRDEGLAWHNRQNYRTERQKFKMILLVSRNGVTNIVNK